MKNIILWFVVLLSTSIFSQDEYIIDNKGKKIIIDNDSSSFETETNLSNSASIKLIIYYTVNGKQEKIYYLDVKEAKIGYYKINTFKFDLEYLEKELPYFIIIESNGYKLICLKKSTINTFCLIVDNSNSIIENLSLKDYTYNFNSLDLESRSRVDKKIRDYFGDCEELIEHLDRYKHNTGTVTYKSYLLSGFRDFSEIEKNLKFQNLNHFLHNPIYFTECN